MICWRYEDTQFALRHNEGCCLFDDHRNARTYAIGQSESYIPKYHQLLLCARTMSFLCPVRSIVATGDNGHKDFFEKED